MEYPPVRVFGPSGKEAIDLAQQLAALKTDQRAEQAPTVKTVGGRTFRQVGDVWVDDRFDPKAEVVSVKAFGSAYFRLLERHPELKDVLALGDRLVWVGPSGRVLVVDREGADEVPDRELETLFAR